MRTESESINELLAEASPRQPLGRLKAFEELQDELGEPAWLSDVEAALDTLEVIAHTQVSPEIARCCKADLEQAERNGWQYGL